MCRQQQTEAPNAREDALLKQTNERTMKTTVTVVDRDEYVGMHAVASHLGPLWEQKSLRRRGESASGQHGEDLPLEPLPLLLAARHHRPPQRVLDLAQEHLALRPALRAP